MLPVSHSAGYEFPVPHWSVASPNEHGMDEELLALVEEECNDQFSYCCAVSRNGVLVGEWYFRGRDAVSRDNVWSVSKSMAVTLLGSLEHQDLVHTEDFASQWITEWLEDRWAANITIENLLRMDSGRCYDPITDFVLPFLPLDLTEDLTQFAIDLPQRRTPGNRYQYAQMGLQVLDRVITSAYGSDAVALAEEVVFGDSGMGYESWDWTRDASGQPLVYTNVQTNCRDVMRFGLLWANHGMWNDTRIFTEDFYRKAMTPVPDKPNDGYVWRLYSDGTYQKRGLGGQFVNVDEENRLVVSRIGPPLPCGSPGRIMNLVRDSLVDGAEKEYADMLAYEDDDVEQERELLDALRDTTTPDVDLTTLDQHGRLHQEQPFTLPDDDEPALLCYKAIES